MNSNQIEKARYWLLVARVAAIWTFIILAGGVCVANFITLRDIQAKNSLIEHHLPPHLKAEAPQS